VNIIAEGHHLFAMLHVTAVGSGNLTADFRHFPKIEEGKIAKFYIFDDSQKMTATMNAA
tara:strand:+ start:139 stop:315 length:177 start_codon:yes stop_codon:yes gene_type:complete